MKIFAIGLFTWIVGACAFYRVWLSRCELKEDDGEWYVNGWRHENKYVYNTPWWMLRTAKLVSFFCWIPGTLIILSRESVLVLGRVMGDVFTLVTPSKIKRQMNRKTLPVSTYDAAMIAAIEEVEYIVTEN